MDSDRNSDSDTDYDSLYACIGWNKEDIKRYRNLKSEVTLYGQQSGSVCGYCKEHESSLLFCMDTKKLAAQDYQDLIDRGWRRSGEFLYLPDTVTSCCPQHTIRLNSTSFTPSKEQKKVARRVERYLAGEWSPHDKHEKFDDHMDITEKSIPMTTLDDYREVIASFCRAKFSLLEAISSNIIERISVRPHIVSKSHRKLLPLSVNGRDVSYVAIHGFGNESIANVAAEALSSILENGTNPLESLKCSIENAIPLKQLVILTLSGLEPIVQSKERPKKCRSDMAKTPKYESHTLRVDTAVANLRDETFNLYKKYQVAIHGDSPNDITRAKFERFLCDSPLLRDSIDENPVIRNTHDDVETIEQRAMETKSSYSQCLNKSTVPSVCGSYHQLYYIDDKLVMVGVLDILPKAVSSVYLFYDPDYSFLSPGVWSALNEVELTCRLAESHPALIYYYMGFYIHSCPKMRYKARMRPSELLSRPTGNWVNFEQCRAVLDSNDALGLGENKNINFESDRVEEDKDYEYWINRIPVNIQSGITNGNFALPVVLWNSLGYNFSSENLHKLLSMYCSAVGNLNSRLQVLF